MPIPSCPPSSSRAKVQVKAADTNSAESFHYAHYEVKKKDIWHEIGAVQTRIGTQDFGYSRGKPWLSRTHWCIARCSLPELPDRSLCLVMQPSLPPTCPHPACTSPLPNLPPFARGWHRQKKGKTRQCRDQGGTGKRQ